MKRDRQLRLVALGLATCVLSAAAWWAYSGASQLGLLRAQTARMSDELVNAQAQNAQIKQMELLASQRQDLKKRVIQTGLVESEWGSRVIQRATAQVSRREAEIFFKQLVSKAGESWFAADSLDVSVGALSQGLFTQPTADDRGFNIQVNGVFYFKAAGK
jgi:TolA-binding protein